ncbi:MAG: hypothetical protein NTW09_03990 [Candidatus Omnitrophica bacterium]|nr:hypothetical protein [Candidatus Omnitrophota bacterium]
MKTFLNRTIFFLGWMLSPFSLWNDAFVNIPLSYIMANLEFRFVHINFLTLVLIFYWISNGLGIALMYLSGKKLVDEKRGVVGGLLSLGVTIAAYSLLLILLNKFGILKPF